MKSVLPITLVLLASLPGISCSSTVGDPTAQVAVGVNPQAPAREIKSYQLVCATALVRQWLFSQPKALSELGAALQKQGYDEALDPTTATYVIRVNLGFGQRVPFEPPENPDSIRHLNVAGMVGQGRYSQILTERHDPVGSLLVGPNGEMIATGGLRQIALENERKMEEAAASANEDALILQVWDVAGADRTAPVLAWELLVRRRADRQVPSPEHVGLLLREAAKRLDAGLPHPPAATVGAPGR